MDVVEQVYAQFGSHGADVYLGLSKVQLSMLYYRMYGYRW